MPRAALLRGKIGRRRHRFTPLSAIHFSGSLALAQPANTIALNGKEKFLASLADMQPASGLSITSAETFAASASLAQSNAILSIAGVEKFFEALNLTAPANTTTICISSVHYPGRVSIADAMQGGLLTMTDLANGSIAATDAALYDVQITETV